MIRFRLPQLQEDAIPHLAIMTAMGQVVSSRDQSEQQGATTPPSLCCRCRLGSTRYRLGPAPS